MAKQNTQPILAENMDRFIDMLRPGKWRWTYCHKGKIVRGGFADTKSDAIWAAEHWRRTYFMDQNELARMQARRNPREL